MVANVSYIVYFYKVSLQKLSLNDRSVHTTLHNLYLCYRHCFEAKKKKWSAREVPNSDKVFCVKPETKRTTEVVSHSVFTAFRLPHLHGK